MSKNTVWVGQTGKAELIGEMHENHLINAYAKIVRENNKPDMRPILAAEIEDRDLLAQMPAHLADQVAVDLAHA